MKKNNFDFAFLTNISVLSQPKVFFIIESEHDEACACYSVLIKGCYAICFKPSDINIKIAM